MDEIQKYTVRANKGRSRIWIEGGRLVRAGFKRGALYVTCPTKENDRIYLVLVPDAESYKGCGKLKKVSGKGERPVIDLSGAGCGPFKTGDAVVIHYDDRGIIEIEHDRP